MTTRREFIKNALIGGTAVFATSRLLSRQAFAELYPGSWPHPQEDEAWAQVPKILKRINAPVFPRRDFHVTRFGAVGDGQTDCADAFRRAITACHQAGGGRVV